jgi:hypothetical protein
MVRNIHVVWLFTTEGRKKAFAFFSSIHLFYVPFSSSSSLPIPEKKLLDKTQVVCSSKMCRRAEWLFILDYIALLMKQRATKAGK